MLDWIDSRRILRNFQVVRLTGSAVLNQMDVRLIIHEYDYRMNDQSIAFTNT